MIALLVAAFAAPPVVRAAPEMPSPPVQKVGLDQPMLGAAMAEQRRTSPISTPQRAPVSQTQPAGWTMPRLPWMPSMPTSPSQKKISNGMVHKKR